MTRKLSVSPIVFNMRLLSLTALMLVTAFAPSAWAQRNPDRPSLEELLPETTVAFMQIKDIKDFAEKTLKGAGGKMMQDEKIAPLVERIVEEGRNAYSKIEDEVGLSVDEWLSIPRGEISFCVIAPRRKNPAYMFVFEVGEDNEAATKAMGILEEKVSEGGNEIDDEELESGVEVKKFVVDGTPIWQAQREGLIVGCSNEKVLNDFFLRWDGQQVEKVRPLIKNRKFVTIMNRCRSLKDVDSEIRFFFDPISLYKSFGRGDVSMQMAIAFLPTLGLDSLLGFGGTITLGEEEYESVMHAHLLLSNPRKGLTNMFALKPADYEPGEWVPDQVHLYMSTSWDVLQTYEEIGGMVDLAMEEGQFEEMVKTNIEDRIDMSMTDDILGQLSGKLTLCQINSVPEKLNTSSWIVGLGLNDAEKGKETVQSLIDYFNENVNLGWEEQQYEGVSYWAASDEVIKERRERQEERRRERNRRRGREEMNEIRAMVRMPFPTLAIIDDTLVFTDSVEAFQQIVDVQNGDAKPLRNDPDFVRMAKQMTNLLGTDMPVALSYNQPRNQLGWMLDMANAESTSAFITSQAENENEFFSVVKGIMDDHELPTMDDINKYIMPSGWFATSDDTGYHLLWFQERLVLEDEE